MDPFSEISACYEAGLTFGTESKAERPIPGNGITKSTDIPRTWLGR